MLRSFVNLQTNARGITSRRGFLGQMMAGAGATALTLSWRDMLLAKAKEVQKAGKSMILLWMDGGPSQYETFNPKIGSQYQGPATAIKPVTLPSSASAKAATCQTVSTPSGTPEPWT